MGGQTHNDGLSEACDACGRDTPHTVTIQIRTEGSKGENTIYSREPYRVSKCDVCDHEEVLRMNNA